MPMHNWKNVTAGTYHFFHHRWISALSDQLNQGLLPSGLFAMAEQIIGGPAPDVVTLQGWSNALDDNTEPSGSIGLAEPAVAPTATYVLQGRAEEYAGKTSQIAIRHELGQVVSVIEIVSPGNKGSKYEIQRLIEKSVALIQAGVNLLIIDPFPPTARDPNGLPALVWEQLNGESAFKLPSDQTRTVSSYQAEPAWERKAYIEPLEVGEPLPNIPLFIVDHRYIQLPLEDSYLETWSKLPRQVQSAVEHPAQDLA